MLGRGLPKCRLPAALLLCAAWSLLCAAQAAAQEKSVSVDSSVAAGSWTAARLRNLPAGASLGIEITTDGALTVILLDATGYQRFPDAGTSLFRGHGSERIEFSASIPEAGDYYLVIDNRSGDTKRTFTLIARAARGDDDGREATDAGTAGSLDEQLAGIAALLERVFVFDALSIRVARCAANAPDVAGDAVVVCAEYARRLLATLEDQERAERTLLFATLHRAGRVLLRQWGYPFYEDVEVADELAAVLMILFKQKDALRSHVEYFASLTPASPVARALADEDPSTLTAPRARELQRLLKDPQRLARWQALLIRHMETGALREMQGRAASSRTRALIDEELARREP